MWANIIASKQFLRFGFSTSIRDISSFLPKHTNYTVQLQIHGKENSLHPIWFCSFLLLASCSALLLSLYPPNYISVCLHFTEKWESPQSLHFFSLFRFSILVSFSELSSVSSASERRMLSDVKLCLSSSFPSLFGGWDVCSHYIFNYYICSPICWLLLNATKHKVSLGSENFPFSRNVHTFNIAGKKFYHMCAKSTRSLIANSPPLASV